MPSLGGLKVSATSAGAAGLTAFRRAPTAPSSTRGAPTTSLPAARRLPATPAALATVQKADPAQVLQARLSAAETAAPVASGVLISVAGGQGVFVSYKGDVYPFKTIAQLAGTVTGAPPPYRSPAPETCRSCAPTRGRDG